MYAIKGIYDGNCFRLERSIPVKEEYKVIITFIDPVKSRQEEILDYFGTWDDSDVECMREVINEREHFSFERVNR